MVSMAHIAIHPVQQTVNLVHVMMSLETVLKDVKLDSMVCSVKTLVLQTVIHQTAQQILAIVTLDALLVSLAINAMNSVLLNALAVVTN